MTGTNHHLWTSDVFMKRLLPLLLAASGACGARAATTPGPIAPRPPVSAAEPARPAPPADEAKPTRVYELEPVRIDVIDTGKGTETHVYDARSLLDDGNDALMQRHYDEALVSY